ncbi:HPr family phosphocarrier protein [Futiania mangrovi]|uniref:HPr family phosphocarrier protein n=1 Tax=Futiania mangrovi TaxID=2959716 RepID=A0A9J6PHE2_9PROT|nr:HPr family phosphocarrier protein [Futiania mangrovii]MCP1337232.1 HPr family phosphocarrier protein [Futiania mangrovii]
MSTGAASPAPGAQRLEREVTIRNAKGLHARASAKFVRCAEVYDAEVIVSKDGQRVAATSIMGLMMLAAGPGSVLKLEAEGPEAAGALDAIAALVDGRFDED